MCRVRLSLLAVVFFLTARPTGGAALAYDLLYAPVMLFNGPGEAPLNDLWMLLPGEA